MGSSGEKEVDSSIGELCKILSKMMEQHKVIPETYKYALESNPTN